MGDVTSGVFVGDFTGCEYECVWQELILLLVALFALESTVHIMQIPGLIYWSRAACLHNVAETQNHGQVKKS